MLRPLSLSLLLLLTLGCNSASPDASEKTRAQYVTHCAHCHNTGAANAPRMGDALAWEKRLKKGKPALVQSIKDGPVAMPKAGGCTTCTDADFVALIDYLSAPQK